MAATTKSATPKTVPQNNFMAYDTYSGEIITESPTYEDLMTKIKAHYNDLAESGDDVDYTVAIYKLHKELNVSVERKAIIKEV